MPYQYLVFCFAHDPAPFVSCREQVVGRVFDTVNARRTVTTDEHNGRCLAKGAVRLWSALKTLCAQKCIRHVTIMLFLYAGARFLKEIFGGSFGLGIPSINIAHA